MRMAQAGPLPPPLALTPPPPAPTPTPSPAEDALRMAGAGARGAAESARLVLEAVTGLGGSSGYQGVWPGLLGPSGVWVGRTARLVLETTGPGGTGGYKGAARQGAAAPSAAAASAAGGGQDAEARPAGGGLLLGPAWRRHRSPRSLRDPRPPAQARAAAAAWPATQRRWGRAPPRAWHQAPPPRTTRCGPLAHSRCRHAISRAQQAGWWELGGTPPSLPTAWNQVRAEAQSAGQRS